MQIKLQITYCTNFNSNMNKHMIMNTNMRLFYNNCVCMYIKVLFITISVVSIIINVIISHHIM